MTIISICLYSSIDYSVYQRKDCVTITKHNVPNPNVIKMLSLQEGLKLKHLLGYFAVHSYDMPQFLKLASHACQEAFKHPLASILRV